MPLVDSHCHINFDGLAERLSEVLDNARRNDVAHLLCVSVNMETFPQVLRLARDYENVFASVGVHPNEQEGYEPDALELLAASGDPNVVAIGETGLDYFRSEGDLDWQRQRFGTHIRAARQASLPLIIHTRDAREDTLRIMREEGAEDAGGVMHCFTETWEMAKGALDMGFHISLSGIVTFRNAEDLRDVARRVPRERLLVETDSPYLAPVPQRGKTNEPAFVRHVAEFVAELRGEEYEDLAEYTTENFFGLFSRAAA